MRPGQVSPDDLGDGRFDTVVLAATDMQGRLFGKRMPVARFLGRDAIHVCTCVLAWDVAQSPELEVAFAGFHTGWHDVRLVPDLSTVRAAAWLERTALCTGDVVADARGTPVAVAPRTILARQVEALAARGLVASVATELEFYLYRTSYDDARAGGYTGLVPSTRTRADYAVREGDEWEWFFGPLRRALDESGIPVELSQVEWGLGQWEVNLVHSDPQAAADAHVLLKLAVRDLAARHGLAATFMPRPSAEDVGSSCHLHLSLRTAGGERAFHDEGAAHGTSACMLHAIGGVLAHLDDAMVWYAPTVNSYRRTADVGFAGRGKTWGYDNRTVSCRVAGDSPESLRLELRVPGSDVNPYLALAALLASVLTGIDDRTDPGAPVEGNAYDLDVEPLVADLPSAAARFEASEWAGAAFGGDVVEHYAAAARFEWAEFMKAVTDWERLRYFEHA